MKEKKLSLVELLQHFFPEIKDSKIFSSKHRIMFIFDGLDECRLPLDFRSKLKCCDATEPVSVDVLLTNLIKRNLLPSAVFWITTRPAAASQIPCEFVDQVTEIRGFNDPQKEEYFRKRIGDENLANRTITHLKSSRTLYIMCHIPVFCWISATVVERTSFESEKVEMPRTLTQMYTHFQIIQTNIRKEKYTERKEKDEEMIFKLGKLAFQQLEEGNPIFYEEDLRECGIDVTEASVYSGVCTQVFREESLLYQGKVFSFVHLSIQEFLAALYVFICFRSIERSMSDQQQTSQLSALFRAATLQDLHKTAVDLALQSENGHLDLFLRFLLGLSLESNQNLLMHLLPQTIRQPQSSEQTVQYVKQKIRDQHNSDRKINLFYCLNELNRHAVVEVIDRSSGALFVDTLIPGEWTTSRFEFKMSEEQLNELDLQKYIKTPETDQTELLSPDEVLQRLVPVVTASTSAKLQYCSLTEKSCAVMASAARSNSCSLKELNLSTNYELHDGVQHLSELLKNPHCKLEKLELHSCSLTEKSCAAIASAAGSNSCSLKELNLSNNELHDAGVQHLSELLKNPHCKLEKLELWSCSLTEKSCAAIASAGRSNSCSLKELNLSENELHDAGVQHLSELLKNPHCKLEKLLLRGCSLTEKSCAALRASAARSNSCSLKELNLSANELHDAGVQHLSELLKNPHCKLEKPELRWCSLTEKSCAALRASAGRSNSCSLKELHLSANELHDAGVQHLSELLKNPHCKLEKPELWNCSLTEKSCAVIASAARSNCNLMELDLSENELHDAGVQHLSELLKNPHCKLETVVLEDCSLTEKSCAAIASAARSNSCSLTELNLSGNEFHDAGVQHLSELLKNPHCKLETLKLMTCGLTKKSCDVIASAARSNSCSLKELNLRDNELYDEGVQYLSELLKNPHCKLEKLELSSNILTEKSCAAIASAARSNSCSLKELHLSHNDLHDAGVQHLSELLKNPHCKLEKLDLSSNRLKEKSCAAIASAATSNSCSLKELDLSFNILHCAGVKHLSAFLKNSHCKLEKLELIGCSLTEKSCAVISKSNSCSLKELDMSKNKLCDAGVKHLSELFKNPLDKLERLVLRDCALTENSCASIASAVISNSCILKELYLSFNKLRDAGVQHLSELLKNPHCKLETLELEECSLTEKSCAAIASADRSNSCSLKILDLSRNKLHDAGVQHLHDLLKNPHCKLENLELRTCSLTEQTCAAIVSVARSNSCSLKKLDLKGNAGIQHVSEFLSNPHCKLETLVLMSCSLTEKSCAAIASAARSNSCSLKELDLSDNELHDAGVQHLSELLKNPHCKLEKVVLHSCSLTEKSCAAIASAARSNSCSLKELNLSDNDLHDAGVQHLSELLKNPHCKLEKLEVDVGIFLKESPAAAAASASSSHSDAAELHLRDKAQQDPGAQLLSLDTHTEEHLIDAPQRSCESCAEVPDSSHWVLLKPEVSTDESVSTYSLSSPAGSYECSESGLRWTCDGPVTLQYCFMDWHVFAEELAHMQSRPAGPLMDIRVMSGELEEIHLPHFLCLGGFEASVGDAVRVLHGRESGVCVEVCELTRHHARLLHPSFSLLGLVYYLRDLFSPKVHCELLLFCTCNAPLVLQAYLVPTYPNDPAHIRAILQKDVEKEKTGVWIDKPRVLGSLREMDTFCVRTSCPSEIQPEKMNLWPLSTGNFCEVYMEQPEKEFDMEVISSQQPIWTVKIRRRDYCKPSRSPGQGSSQGTNTERLAQVRPGLISGVSRGVLRSTLDRLQAHRPPVLSSREAEEVLQRSQVLQDQVSCLVDMVHRKGDTACSIMLALLEELDPHLHGELRL
ncbi:LOW QUALITY PROTEIN: uncharacterized protein LOC121700216 [Alosa sapidissima]|uniref:LOW QUALITY PROTEIN: uncharacterized protein LOC121700216 n=1 Tax=Alosa sapidissima TaxID=34773 RepID=UPI001C09CE57|nr:LOW QUALITY PROTEIN: uncharacterized protein LOC121700216 [Alosa sapidissima]